jgi:hypothetical protein
MPVFTPALRHKVSAACAGYVSRTESVFEWYWSSPRRHETVITATPQGEPAAPANATEGATRR